MFIGKQAEKIQRETNRSAVRSFCLLTVTAVTVNAASQHRCLHNCSNETLQYQTGILLHDLHTDRTVMFPSTLRVQDRTRDPRSLFPSYLNSSSEQGISSPRFLHVPGYAPPQEGSRRRCLDGFSAQAYVKHNPEQQGAQLTLIWQGLTGVIQEKKMFFLK